MVEVAVAEENVAAVIKAVVAETKIFLVKNLMEEEDHLLEEVAQIIAAAEEDRTSKVL